MTVGSVELEKDDRIALFLARITGSEIADVSAFPEIQTGSERRFTYDLTLEGPQQYTLNAEFDFAWDWKDVDYRVSLGCDGQTVYDKGGGSTVCRVPSGRTPEEIELFMGDYMHKTIGGPSTELPFMDYESYTVAGLKDGDESYFANPYLVMMAHRRENGIPVPPILGKREAVQTPMRKGRVEETQRALQSMMVLEGGLYDQACQGHMQEESDVIMQRAVYEQRKRDKQVPLHEAFDYLEIPELVEEGDKSARPLNILVVENTDYACPVFEVRRNLEADGRFRGSQLYTEFNLPCAIEVCATGKVDFVVFDWRNPSPMEALMYRPAQNNPIYDMYNPGLQGVLSLESGKMEVQMPDGSTRDYEGIKELAERLDIRERWMDMIAGQCREEGVEPPGHFVVKSQAEMGQIGKIIAYKTGRW